MCAKALRQFVAKIIAQDFFAGIQQGVAFQQIVRALFFIELKRQIAQYRGQQLLQPGRRLLQFATVHLRAQRGLLFCKLGVKAGHSVLKALHAHSSSL
ncbi:hypothetical protein SDC9_139532 [bioreactor metagenome]|uniref:Uncharacterized protein n=1 Tax=bioreactor metagenome TaxID=1076179 RepID=A0A645DSS3_9ZZZZ